jgi:hypothetical protein
MSTDDNAPLVTNIETRTKRKRTLREQSMVFIAIAWSFLAGMEAQKAIQRFRKDGSDSDWLFWAVISLFFLGSSIFWILRILRDRGEGASPSAPANQ